MPVRRIFLPIVLAACGAAALPGCSGNAASRPTPEPTSGGSGSPVKATTTRDLAPATTPSDVATLVTGNTDFGFDLYHGLSTSRTTGNLFYSPYSVSLALAMTYAGAEGQTASQMAAALHFTLPEAQLNPAFDKLDLAIEATPPNAQGSDGTPFALSLADSLWGDEHVTFGQSFVNTLAADYGASLRTVDFVDNAAAAETAINGWVSTETNGKINPLLGPGAVNQNTELVLVNTVYFNAAWASPFNKAATAPATFTRADGTTVQAPTMSTTSPVSARYATGANFAAVELPYSGGTTSMVIVLPDTGAYATLEAGLSGSFFSSVTASLAPAQLSLKMPSFKIHGGTVSLVTELEALGMVDSFGANANFTAMIPAGGVHVADVLHQAFVDVDESGTEAAAATAVVVATNGVEEGTPVAVDRAFFFFIRDVATGTVLFVGRENDPTTTD
jgi:serpin B